MADVFVSYKAEDRRRVRPLVESLMAEKFSIWWDAHLDGGEEWRRSIEEQLERARCVLVVWSKQSTAPGGRFVRDEASRAMERGVYLPVQIDNVRLPLGFGETQAISLIGWRGDASDSRFRAVVGATRRVISGQQPSSFYSPPDHPISRRSVVAGGAVAATVAGAGGWALLKPSTASGAIAVLPFANLSGDPARTYFSDGIAEEIRSALSRVPGMEVVGRTSSEAVRNLDAAGAATRLGVAHIVTGSVRESSRIRVKAEMMDRKGIDQWSQDYDRVPGDAIAIQTDIAQNVASSLSRALGQAAKAALRIGGTQNAEAQRLYIEAKALRNEQPKKGIRADWDRALHLLDEATAMDPDYADAYAVKAETLMDYSSRWVTDLDQFSANRERAMKLAQIAGRLAPDLAEVHQALANVYCSDLQLARGLQESRHSVQLAPGNVDILVDYISFLATLGHAQEALRLADRAIQMDPLNWYPYFWRIQALFYARRYAEVVSYSDQLHRNSPDLFLPLWTIGDALTLLGRFDEARASYKRIRRTAPASLTSKAILGVRSGNEAELKTNLTALRKYGEAASYQYAEIYAQIRDLDRAFGSLDRAVELKDGGLIALRADPWLDPIRSDRRYDAVIRKLGLGAV